MLTKQPHLEDPKFAKTSSHYYLMTTSFSEEEKCDLDILY